MQHSKGEAEISIQRQANPMGRSSFWKQPDVILGLVLLIFFLGGLLLATHYGESWDEPFRMSYARRSMGAYSGGNSNLPDEKGPFWGMTSILGATVMTALNPGWKTIDGWHLMTYFTFLMGLYFFYRLCRRLIDPWPALAATLLFATQPVVWGHAFQNPKDIPFMAFFLASVVLGLDMVDRFYPQGPGKEPGAASLPQENHDWQAATQQSRRLMMALGAAWICLPVVFPLVQALVAAAVVQIYSASPTDWVGKLFSSIASNAGKIPAQAYIHKAQTQTSWLAMILWAGLGIALLVAARQVFPSAWAWLMETRLPKPFQGAEEMKAAGGGRKGIAVFLREIARPQFLVAAFFLGFTSDIRTLGLAAGMLVAVYALIQSRGRSILRLGVYFGIAIGVIYAFWPYLWSAPLAHYLRSLSKVQNFDWSGVVLFAGQIFQHGNIPNSYLPVLLSLQFTETSLAMIAAGLAVAGVYLWKKASLRIVILMLGAWIVLPILAAIQLHSTLYDNFRQFLFVIPPLFVLVGLAFQMLWSLLVQINRRLVFAFVSLALLIPGVYWDVHLHPFEYIYYNGFAGGVAGAYRSYDLDYWATSYREDLEYVNKVAPPNAAILVYGADESAKTYARSDLKIVAYPIPADFQGAIDFAVVITAGNEDQFLYPKAKILYQATRDGAVLSVVKQILPGEQIGN